MSYLIFPLLAHIGLYI